MAALAALLGVGSVVGAWAQIGSVISAHDAGVPFIFVGSSTTGGGALVAEHDFLAPVLVTESARVGGFVLYTATDPSFEPLDVEDAEIFFITDGTTVSVEITALDPQVAVELGGIKLDHVGASVVLGTARTLHQHPEWQLTLPEGETDCQTISFRLTTNSPTYAASEAYTAYVTNDALSCPLPMPTPTTTAAPTPVPTATAGAGQTCGDADASGTVTVSDGVNVLRSAAGLSSTCTVAVCDVDGNGQVSVTDGVNVLRAAAGLSAELSCPDL